MKLPTSYGGIALSSQVVVLEEPHSVGEWRIGYVDEVPAVGDRDGRWYRVPKDAVIPHASTQLVWLRQQDEWTCIHQRHWDPQKVPPTPMEVLVKDGPVFVEPRE